MPIPGQASDICDDALDYEVSAVLMSGGCIGTWYRTWTATDDCGNSSSAEQLITLMDVTAPTFETVPADTTIVLNAFCDANYVVEVTGGYPSVSDNCDVCFDQNLVVDYTESDAVYTCEGDDDMLEGTRYIERTWTVTDQCGNSSNHVQVITLEDDSAPTGSAEAVTLDCATYRDAADQMFGAIEAHDNCDSDVAISFDVANDTIVSVNAEIGVPASSTGCYTVIRTITLTDDCGHQTDIEQVITVEDNTAPIYQGPGQISIPAVEYDVEGAYAPDVVWAYPVGSEFESFPIGYIDDCSGLFTCTAEDFPISGGCANQPHPAYNSESATYLRVLTITDLCGNTSTAEVIINLIDEDAPVFDFVPADAEFTCDEDVVLLDPTFYDLVDENVALDYEEAYMDLGCEHSYVLIRTWTITDNCDNSAEAQQIITVSDEIAPVIDEAAQDETIECAGNPANNAALAQWLGNVGGAAASDNCAGAVSWSTVPANPALSNDCGRTGSVEVTFVATDLCGNSSSTVATFTVEDTTAPVIDDEAEDLTIECGDYLSGEIVTDQEQFQDWLTSRAGATRLSDACGNTSWSRIPANPVLSDGCGETGEVTVTWVLTDACGLTDSTTATFTIIDTTVPAITEEAQDEVVECDGAGNSAQLQAWLDSNGNAIAVDFGEDEATGDICGGVTWSNDFISLEASCGATGSAEVTFTATDECGNSSSSVATFTIEDTTAPQLANTPASVGNNGAVAIPYDNYCGDVTLPAIADVSATDICSSAASCDESSTSAANDAISALLGSDILGEDGQLDLLTEVTTTGVNNPFVTGGEYTIGTVSTPATLGDGETCDNNSNQHGMRMFNFLGGEYYVTDGGSMRKDEDGTATVSMVVSNGTGSFEVEAQFGSLMNWEEWCATPGLESFKSDCGLGDHFAWEYAILLDGTITGVEGSAFEGTELSMSHQPANEYFGFQFGVGANNKNANYGFSGWFYYGGTLVVNGEESSAMGSGDLFGDLDFLQAWETTFHFCAVDECGIEVTYQYSYVSTGMIQDITPDGGVEGEQDAEPTVMKDLIEITSIYPNPTASHAMLTVEVQEDVTAKIQIMTMDGSLVNQVFDGLLIEGWPTNFTLDVNSLESGLYQVRVSSKNFVTTKKLLVIE